MRTIIDTALPFFALLLCGFMAVRWKILDAASARGINAFVFWLALPALLLSSVAASSLPQLLDLKLLGVFYGVNAILYIGTFIYGRLAWGDPPGMAGLRSLGVIWGNYGYLGLPLLTAALGPAAALPAITVVTFDILVPATITIVLLEAGRSGRISLKALALALGGVVRNPLIVAVVIGVVFSSFALPMPVVAANFLRILGAAAGPCALVALGASLALSPSGGAIREVSLVTVLKLFANPIMVWYAGIHVIPLEPMKLAAVTLLAAMPTAASVFVLAQRYETWVLRASTSVLLTHLGSVVTLGLLLYALGR